MFTFSASQRQKEIYLGGSKGNRPLIPTDFKLLEAEAMKRLHSNAFGYIATGAGMEQGIKNNDNAFNKYTIRPRMASGVSEVDLSCQLFDEKLNSPMIIAPIGVLGLAHKNADLELAAASKHLQVPMVFSNQASVPMEQCSDVLRDSNYWFQLYFSKSKELVESFISRAEKCGCKAIVLTLDTTQLGWRPRDLNNAYLPFMEGKGIAQYTSDPVFQKLMTEHNFSKNKTKINFHSIKLLHKLAGNYPGNYLRNLFSKKPIQAVRTFIDIYSRPGLDWNDIKWLRSITHLPILLKGILRADDALQAIDCGINGIIVSNHGGRQIDHVHSSLEALVTIKAAVPVHYPLLFDSGIRKGADIFIALSLGAKAVLLGRSYAYALGIAGKEGVIELCKNYMAELEIMMALCGVNQIEDLYTNRNEILSVNIK